MASTRKKRQSTRRLYSQLNNFDRDIIFGNATSDRQENFVVIEGTVAVFGNVSVRINTLHVFITIDETRKIISDEVSELSVLGTQFDRQPQLHQS